ncbi:hypothetical protein GUJ93_ZPchr0007g5472 [Zizania palustris]|uniref:RING-type domain-containing protein n=1 Tax=Zizania palustris TaxID=103762 RepID=A0A8J5VRQ4_ZIZPA|nr:hypothetical protein GUJ93_ZPchr0007g5472 [Zizania palustris]
MDEAIMEIAAPENKIQFCSGLVVLYFAGVSTYARISELTSDPELELLTYEPFACSAIHNRRDDEQQHTRFMFCAICCMIFDDDSELTEPVYYAAGGGENRRWLLNSEVVIDVVPPAAAGDAGESATEATRSDEALCAICIGRLADGGKKCWRLRPCGHVYHAECVGLWLRRETTCPLCRAAVVNVVGAVTAAA